MKLSFSTKGWHGYLWEDFTRIASEQGFNGIELHNVNNPSFTEKNGAFYMSSAQATVRELYEKNLRIPCIDTLKNPASKEEREALRKEELQNKKLATADLVRQEYEESSTGFLQELEILFKQIIFKKIVALIFYVFLFFFLMLLELLVVMSKGGDGDSDYDLIVHHQLQIKAATLKRMEEGLLSKVNEK